LGNKSFYRKLIVGAVDLQTGSFLNIDMDDLELDERATAILASASVPGAFPVT
jgi:predicted acylesterase/phospholipase RssA